MELVNRINETTNFLTEKGFSNVEVAVILGTGLGTGFLNSMEIEIELPYEEIPHFPTSTVEFHHGKLILGTIEGKRILAFQGRFHRYEGYSLEEVTYPVRICKSLEANYLLISNAAGGLNLDWNKGDLMMLDDHINLQIESPLVGPNHNGLGSRFPDMSQPYNPELRQTLRSISTEKGITRGTK